MVFCDSALYGLEQRGVILCCGRGFLDGHNGFIFQLKDCALSTQQVWMAGGYRVFQVVWVDVSAFDNEQVLPSTCNVEIALFIDEAQIPCAEEMLPGLLLERGLVHFLAKFFSSPVALGDGRTLDPYLADLFVVATLLRFWMNNTGFVSINDWTTRDKANARFILCTL